MIKRVLLTFLLSALFGAKAYAATYTAASCSSGQVQAAINQTKNGDTVIIPSGTCTWTSVLTINNNITLQGSGQSSTIIIDNVTSGAGLVINISGSTLSRTTGFTWEAGSSLSSLQNSISINGSATNPATSFRMDDMTFTGWGGTVSLYVMYTDNVFGVFDHNTITMPYEVFVNVQSSAYEGVGAHGDNSWAQPDSYGTANALYFEDNTFTFTSALGSVSDCDGNACRMVWRYNTLQQASVVNHGTESPGRNRGGRHMEVYNNTFIANQAIPNNINAALTIRSGTALVYNNTVQVINYAGFAPYNNLISLLLQRAHDSFPPWGACDGNGPYDQNDGVTYASGTATAGGTNNVVTDSTQSWATNQWFQSGSPYSIINTTQGWGSEIVSNTSNTITSQTGAGYGGVNDTHPWSIGDGYQIKRAKVCIDQPTRGQGNLLSGAAPSPTGWVGDTLDPVYTFNNISGANVSFSFGFVGPSSARMISNRDYYSQCGSYTGSTCASFTGASGTGSGLLSARPSTCTPAVAYWATDQSELYICTATNTWTASYTPYTYPHPLTLGQTPDPPPAAPQNLTVTLH